MRYVFFYVSFGRLLLLQKIDSYASLSFNIAVFFFIILSDNKALIEKMQNKVAELESESTIIHKHCN